MNTEPYSVFIGFRPRAGWVYVVKHYMHLFCFNNLVRTRIDTDRHPFTEIYCYLVYIFKIQQVIYLANLNLILFASLLFSFKILDKKFKLSSKRSS